MADSSVPRLYCGIVLHTDEESGEIVTASGVETVRYAPQFPRPRAERVSPGHLLAVAVAPEGAAVAVWRWYDAVVLGPAPDGCTRLWEPAHGEVVGRLRHPESAPQPGTRAYASAGLPGAEWWVAGPIGPDTVVDLDEVLDLYDEYDVWDSALA